MPSWDNGNSFKGQRNYSVTSWPGTPKRTHTQRKKRQLDWGLLLEKEPHIKGPLQLHLSQWLDWLEQNSAVHMRNILNLSYTVLPTRLPEKRTKTFLTTFYLPWLFHRPGSPLCVAPPAQAYHASRLRRFRQTVFASSAILPAGCLYGSVVPCCYVLLGA